MSKSALVGHTGFVGTTLLSQTNFDDLYNSKNIEEIQGKDYELIVCAAAPAVKWKANQEPKEDLENINRLMLSLKKAKADLFVLISTVDVYMNPINVDEDTSIDPEVTEPYGRHRYYLEQFVEETFPNHLIIRLPGLFGEGLKKNFIYDLIHSNALHLTHGQSEFQFYNMRYLWNDIKVAIDHSLSLVNFTTEPVSASEISEFNSGNTFLNVTEKKPVYYDMRSKHGQIYNPEINNGYFKSKEVILQEISSFINEEKGKLQ